ncbi:MAG TPA: FAD-dependent oxidoreductase [Propionicimonas sp.]|jgi:hypothetical protein
MTADEVVVYGATPAGVIAAVAAARSGATVTVVDGAAHVGGMLASGLNTAEAEHMLPESFSGMPLEFYRRIGAAYARFGPLFHWESHVAEQVFRDMLQEAGVRLMLGTRLGAVTKESGHITALELDGGPRLTGDGWIDATYEGDLMAAAGVAFRVGREARDEYDEPLAGVRFNEPDDVELDWGARTGDAPIDVAPFAPDGSLRPFFVPAVTPGAADPTTMNYHYRITLSTAPDRVPIGPPDGYDAGRFDDLSAYLQGHPDLRLEDVLDVYPHPSGRYGYRDDGRTVAHPGEKWEINNRQSAVISLGHFGGQVGYLEGNTEDRRRILEDHRRHNQGLLYFLGHDATAPLPIRTQMRRYGLPADEYTDNGHWPYELYVREGRRMVGRYVMTQRDLQETRAKPDAIAVGSHYIDSHHVQRVVASPTSYRNEGRIWVATDRPYHIPFGAILPPAGSVENLAVPVCLSATHVAFSSIRVETTWMALGEAAGVAAAIGVRAKVPLGRVAAADVKRGLAGTLHLGRLPR